MFKKIKNLITPFFLVLLAIFLFIYIKYLIPQAESKIRIISNKATEYFFIILPKAITVIVIILLTRIFINFSLNKIKKTLEAKQRTQDLLLIEYPYKFFIWFIAILISIAIIFRNFASLLTSLGLIGFGVTFALQKPILNFVGWLTIITRRPYWIGDRVEILLPGGLIKGDVYDMNIMYTSLSEFASTSGDLSSGKAITIPNEYVLTQAIVNYTKGSPFIWDTIPISLTYKSDIKQASHIIENAAQKIVGDTMKSLAEKWKKDKRKFEILGKEIRDGPSVNIEMTDAYITLKLSYVTDSRKRAQTKTEITKIILEDISNAKNIELAQNQNYINKK